MVKTRKHITQSYFSPNNLGTQKTELSEKRYVHFVVDRKSTDSHKTTIEKNDETTKWKKKLCPFRICG